jgi:tripartite ATP-independent transporter DctP family solute receptor
VALVVLAGLATGCGPRRGAGDREIWRFAIEETQGSVQDAYAQRFKELVEERSGGEISVKVYPYGTLGTSDQMTEQLHNGTIEFAMSSPGHLGKLIPEVQVFLLHFIFSDDEEVDNRVLRDPELLRTFDTLYEEKGLKLLTFFPEGWMVWTADRPIRRPEDFGGVKFRVMTSPLLIEAYDAYGASPTPLPYSEVYSGLQLSMIDGQVNPVFAIEEMSFYEVSETMIFPKHALFITSAVTGQEFFESLSPERREMVRSVVRDLQDEIFEIQRTFNRQRLETIEERNPDLEIIRLTEEQRQQFREASLPVRETFVDSVGPKGEEILDLILESVHEEERKQERSATDEPSS